MNDSFIDVKNDGACLPCKMPKKTLLSKLEQFEEFKPILDKFWQEFDSSKEHFVSEEDTAVVYDKYDNRYSRIHISLEEREQEAREQLCCDESGYFYEIVSSSELTDKLVEFFRNLAKEKFM